MDKDKCRKPDHDAWREHASEYEQGFIDGMQEQMKRSVDRAVNALADKREWVGLTDEEVEQLAAQVWFGGASAGHERFAKLIEAKLKEKNT